MLKTQRTSSRIKRTALQIVVIACAVIVSLNILPVPQLCQAARRRHHKRFIIHIPMQIKTHHHTHTVYSHIRTGGTKQTIYKILGYASYGGHGGGGGGGGGGKSSYVDHNHDIGNGGVMMAHSASNAAYNQQPSHPCDDMDYDEVLVPQQSQMKNFVQQRHHLFQKPSSSHQPLTRHLIPQMHSNANRYQRHQYHRQHAQIQPHYHVQPARGQGDMIFNHFARSDELIYPDNASATDIEDFVDADEWV